MTATIGRRVQGRPARGEGDVGRERLIEATRAVLRAAVPPDVSRKAVAAAAGVTPALVTYYFPDKAELLQAATGPLLHQRIAELLDVLDGAGDWQGKLVDLVHLLVGLNETEAHLVDAAIAICTGAGRDADCAPHVMLAYGRLRAFYLEGVQAGAWRALDPDVFLFALWGMCKFAARSQAGEGQEATRLRAETVIDLAFNGVRRR